MTFSMVARDLAQFLQPNCVLFLKTETGFPQFTPANVFSHFAIRGYFSKDWLDYFWLSFSITCPRKPASFPKPYTSLLVSPVLWALPYWRNVWATSGFFSQLCLQCFQLCHQAISQNPILTFIQEEDTGLQHRVAWQRTKITLKHTNTSIMEEGSLCFLDVLYTVCYSTCCQKIPLPLIAQAFSCFSSW